MAIQAFGSQIWVPPLLDAVASVLYNGLGLPPDRVFNSIWDDQTLLEFPPADQFITLFAPNFPVDQTDVRGGGSINTAFDAKLHIKLFKRVESDIETRSYQYLNDEVNGVYTFAQQVITILQMWPGPDDGTGTSQLRRPMRIMPGFDVDGRTVKDGKRWGLVKTVWEMSFVANLSNPYPAGS